MKLHSVALIGVWVLAGCPEPRESDSGSLGCPDTGCEGLRPPTPQITFEWDGEGLTVMLEDITTSGFDLGIAETADPDNGWFGEDCLHGTAPYQMCHVLNNTLRGNLDSVHDEIAAGGSFDLVVPNETTYFDESFADRLTYVVTIDGGDCWVFGHDPSYYTSASSFSDCSSVP